VPVISIAQRSGELAQQGGPSKLRQDQRRRPWSSPWARQPGRHILYRPGRARPGPMVRVTVNAQYLCLCTAPEPVSSEAGDFVICACAKWGESTARPPARAQRACRCAAGTVLSGCRCGPPIPWRRVVKMISCLIATNQRAGGDGFCQPLLARNTPSSAAARHNNGGRGQSRLVSNPHTGPAPARLIAASGSSPASVSRFFQLRRKVGCQ